MTPLVIFISVVTLFVIGSLAGWIIEVFFRRFFSAHHWVNPGFLVGPYLPIYGIGTIALYGLSNIDMTGNAYLAANTWLIVIIKILMIAVIMVLVEFLVGLIFIKGMKIKLWDYSKRPGNIMGIICPLFSVLWLVAGALYYFFVNPYLVQAVYWLSENTIYYFFIGIVIGGIIVDACYSFHVATKIRKAAKESRITVSLENLRESARNKYQEAKEGLEGKARQAGFFIPFKGDIPIKDQVESYLKSKFYPYEDRQNDQRAERKRLLRKSKKEEKEKGTK